MLIRSNMKFNALIPVFYISNIKNSLKFYSQILGFVVEYTREEEGFAFLSLGKAQVMISEIGIGDTWNTDKLEYPFGRGINFQIEVKNIEPLIKKLKSEKCPLFRKTEEKWYRKDKQLLGNRQFLVQDPDGYLLRFFQNIGTKSAE